MGGDFCILEPQRIFLRQVSFEVILLEYETLRTGYSHAADLKVGHTSCFAAMSTDRMKREVPWTALQISQRWCKVLIDAPTSDLKPYRFRLYSDRCKVLRNLEGIIEKGSFNEQCSLHRKC